MIKSKNGKTKVRGTGIDVINDFLSITDTIADAFEEKGLNKERSVEFFREIVGLIPLSEEEKEKKAIIVVNNALARALSEGREEKHE